MCCFTSTVGANLCEKSALFTNKSFYGSDDFDVKNKYITV